MSTDTNEISRKRKPPFCSRRYRAYTVRMLFADFADVTDDAIAKLHVT